MAYNNSDERLLELKKNNKGDYLVVAKITNNSTKEVSADIRNYYTDKNDDVQPTTKGVRINSEMLPEVMEKLITIMEFDELQDLYEKIGQLLEDEEDIEDIEEE
jgi:hypothetical protein